MPFAIMYTCIYLHLRRGGQLNTDSISVAQISTPVKLAVFCCTKLNLAWKQNHNLDSKIGLHNEIGVFPIGSIR